MGDSSWLPGLPRASRNQWCALNGTDIGGASCGLVFVGPAHELRNDAALGSASLASASAARPGWTALPEYIRLSDAGGNSNDDDDDDSAAARDKRDSRYYPMGRKMTRELAGRLWPEPAVVIARPTVLLSTDYCLGTRPQFLLTAPAGSAGFTVRDLASASAAAYQWAYDAEDAVSVPAAMGLMLNRGPSTGPFRISMHYIEDLQLHSWFVEGSVPAGGGSGRPAAVGAKSGDDCVAVATAAHGKTVRCTPDVHFPTLEHSCVLSPYLRTRAPEVRAPYA